MKKKIIVFFHSNCPDGFSSAWIFRKKFGNQAEYLNFNYHQNVPVNIHNNTIYFVDVSPNKEIIQTLVKDNQVILIDHHVSSREKLSLFTEVVFDTHHSAAVLAWNYLFAKKSMPTLFKYVEDIDLWKFDLPFSQELNCVVDTYDFTFDNWTKLVRLFNNKRELKKLISFGKNILQYQQKLVRDLAKKAELVEFEQEKVLAINTPILISETGNYLLKYRGPFSIVWHKTNQKILVSLRADGKYDVSKLAEKYGGGGHKNAAGFIFDDLNKLPWKNIN